MNVKVVFIVKIIVKALLKLTLAITLLLFLLWLPAWYYAKPVNEFCNGLTDNSTYSNVLSKAKSLKYRVFDDVKENSGTVSVETNDGVFLEWLALLHLTTVKLLKNRFEMLISKQRCQPT